jgi:hypothetical protein
MVLDVSDSLMFIPAQKSAGSDIFQESAHSTGGLGLVEWTSPWSDQKAIKYRLRMTIVTTNGGLAGAYNFGLGIGDGFAGGGQLFYTYPLPAGTKVLANIDTTVDLSNMASIFDGNLTFGLGVSGTPGNVTVHEMTLALTPL